MQGLFHRVTIVIDTDESERLKEVVRFTVGLKGILAPDVELDYAVELNDKLVELERINSHDDEPF